MSYLIDLLLNVTNHIFNPVKSIINMLKVIGQAGLEILEKYQQVNTPSGLITHWSAHLYGKFNRNLPPDLETF